MGRGRVAAMPAAAGGASACWRASLGCPVDDDVVTPARGQLTNVPTACRPRAAHRSSKRRINGSFSLTPIPLDINQ